MDLAHLPPALVRSGRVELWLEMKLPDAEAAKGGRKRRGLVAAHLLKWVEYQVDTQGRPCELRYFRDIEGREVDFVVTEDGAPILLVECKSSDREISPALRYLKVRFPDAQAWQISAGGRNEYVSPEGIRVAPALRLKTCITHCCPVQNTSGSTRPS